MAAYTSSQLGWNPASSSINGQLVNFINNISVAGDSLHLQGMFKVDVSVQRRITWKQITITAEDGCGFDFVNLNTTNGDEFFRVGSGGMILDNMLFQASGAPETGFSGNEPGAPGEHYLKGVMIDNRGFPMTIRSSTFRHNVETHLALSGTNALDARNVHFRRGKQNIGIQAGSSNVRIHQCLFDDALIDGIKTVFGGTWANANTGWLITETIFQGSRDGMDLTGGLQFTTIRDCQFRRLNVCGLDLKTYIEQQSWTSPQSAWPLNARCMEIDIINCLFEDVNSACVNSFLNKTGITYTYAFQEAMVPQNTRLTNCTIARSTARSNDCRVLLSKMGRDFTATGTIMRGWIEGAAQSVPYTQTTEEPYGDLIEETDSVEEQDGWNSHDISVTIVSKQAAQAPTTAIPFVYGQGGTPPDPDPDPDPEPDPEIPPAPVAPGPALSVNPTTGILTMDPSRLPLMVAKDVTVRATTAHGSAADTFAVTNAAP